MYKTNVTTTITGTPDLSKVCQHQNSENIFYLFHNHMVHTRDDQEVGVKTIFNFPRQQWGSIG